MAQTGRELLARLSADLRGKSDDEIRAITAEAGGIEHVIDDALEQMRAGFVPGRAVDCVHAYVFTDGDARYPRTVEVAGRQATIHKRDADDARVTVRMPAPDFVRVGTGQLTGPAAWTDGRITAEGDIAFIHTFMAVFGQA